jgi:hypothetical protein
MRVQWVAVAILFAAVAWPAEAPRVVENVLVYHQAGRFGGWPANNGIWSWGNEILVGFWAGYSQRMPDNQHQMPSTVRLPDGSLLTATRTHVGQKVGADLPELNRLDLFRGAGDGSRWTFASTSVLSTGAHGGNPPHLIRLHDGRLCLTYGYRSAPYGIRARLSSDDGKTGSREFVLRADGGTWDLGYVRSAERPDGKIVSVYYFNDQPSGERYIAATIWDPGVRTDSPTP